MRDTRNNTNIVTAIAPAAYLDDNPPIVIDRLGFQALTFALHVGAGGIAFTSTNRIDFILEHGSAPDGSDMVPVGVDNVLGAAPDASGIIRSQRTAHAAVTVDRIGYVDGTIADKRYVRLRADFNGIHANGTPISALAILSKGLMAPIA